MSDAFWILGGTMILAVCLVFAYIVWAVPRRRRPERNLVAGWRMTPEQVEFFRRYPNADPKVHRARGPFR